MAKYFQTENDRLHLSNQQVLSRLRKKFTHKYFPDLGNFTYICTVSIITKKRLEDFAKQYPDAKSALKFWYDVVTANNFYSAQEVIQVFKTADYVGNERLVFNMAHNKYRLVAKFKFHRRAQRVSIRFVGTHAEYDKIKDIQDV